MASKPNRKRNRGDADYEDGPRPKDYRLAKRQLRENDED